MASRRGRDHRRKEPPLASRSARAAAPILIALGANLPHPLHGPPARTLHAVLLAFPRHGIRVLRRSRLYRTAPLPPAPQPWFVNAVVRVATDLSPSRLLATLHRIEAEFGRARSTKNAPRVLDLDLIAHGAHVMDGGASGRLTLPHPRLGTRAFVLRPLADVAPAWREPRSGARVADLLAALPQGQRIRVAGWPKGRRAALRRRPRPCVAAESDDI